MVETVESLSDEANCSDLKLLGGSQDSNPDLSNSKSCVPPALSRQLALWAVVQYFRSTNRSDKGGLSVQGRHRG